MASIPDGGSLEFFTDWIFPAHGPRVDVAFNANEWRGGGLFLGAGETAGAEGWQLYQLHVLIVYKLWKPQQPVQTCNGLAF